MSSSGKFNTIYFQNAFPLSTITAGYPALTTLAVGNNGYLQPYSFYSYQSTSGFTDTSTITSGISSYIDNQISSVIQNISSSLSTLTCSLSNNLTTSLNNTINIIPKTKFYSINNNKNFVSTYNGNYPQGPISIATNKIILSDQLKSLINEGNYCVNVNFEYSIYVSTTSLQTPSFTWISTIGVFDNLSLINKGTFINSRLGNNQYSQINNSLTFLPFNVIGTTNQIPNNIHNFHIEFCLSNSGSTLPNATIPYFDIYMPASNNITFTLIPISYYGRV